MPHQNSDVSRANGAKSKGPITPEGKARSAANSLRHGLCSQEVVLPHEDRSQFEAHRKSYMDSFQPADQPEADLVETMASARWRLNRLVFMENKIFEAEILRHSKEAEKEFFVIGQSEKLAWTFDHMANNSKSLQLLIRYEGSLNRTYERALKQLQTLQSMRQSGAGDLVACQVRNEPRPAPQPMPDPPQIDPQPASATLETPEPADSPSETPGQEGSLC